MNIRLLQASAEDININRPAVILLDYELSSPRDESVAAEVFVHIDGSVETCTALLEPGRNRASCTVRSEKFREPGKHRLIITVDEENLLAETDEQDNSALAAIFVRPVANIRLLDAEPVSDLRVGSPARFAISYELDTPFQGLSSDVSIYRDGVLTAVCPVFFSPGIGSARCAVQPSSRPGRYVLKFAADSPNLIAELDEKDNNITIQVAVVR
ncbi:hypothetical protein GF351_04025 [Candidatus Woesearchaeota archaeon]|nr:hypothetical protein [Candidatus Woesearchaeota archaeon]